jgi:hypothetical protein
MIGWGYVLRLPSDQSYLPSSFPSEGDASMGRRAEESEDSRRPNPNHFQSERAEKLENPPSSEGT